MTGANMKTTDSYLRIKMTPDGRPSYLNDLIANLLQFVDQAEIRTTQGVNAPFNYRLAPLATITSGSDHSVFLAAAIPAMQFNYWPDNFYHSSEDRIVHVDPTELKRVGFIGRLGLLLPGQRRRARSPQPGLGSGGQRREMDRRGRPPERPPAGDGSGQDPRPTQGRPDQGGRRVRAGQGGRRIRPDPGHVARGGEPRSACSTASLEANRDTRGQTARSRLPGPVRRRSG